MKIDLPRARSSRRQAAFTLVEVALSLGIAGFVLAGLIGAIPLASDVGRQSITQTRAASIASTVFANLRAQKFGAAAYLDNGPAVNLNGTIQSGTVSPPSPVTYFAYFDEAVTSVPSGSDDRRLHFVSTAPAGVTAFQITLRFDNHPAGTLPPYILAASTPRAQADTVEAAIFAVARPKELYRFSSVVANRTE